MRRHEGTRVLLALCATLVTLALGAPSPAQAPHTEPTAGAASGEPQGGKPPGDTHAQGEPSEAPGAAGGEESGAGPSAEGGEAPIEGAGPEAEGPAAEAGEGPAEGAEDAERVEPTEAEAARAEPTAPQGGPAGAEAAGEEDVPPPKVFAGAMDEIARDQRTGVRPETVLNRLRQLAQDATVDLYDIKSRLNAADIAAQDARTDNRRLLELRERGPEAVAAADWTEQRARAEVDGLRALFATYRDLFQKANDRAWGAQALAAGFEQDLNRAERLHQSLQLGGAAELAEEAARVADTLRERRDEAQRLEERWMAVKGVAGQNFQLASDVTRELVRAIPLGQKRSLWLRSEDRITLATFTKAGLELERLVAWSVGAVTSAPGHIRSWSSELRRGPVLFAFVARLIGVLVVLGLGWWFTPWLRSYLGQRLRPPLDEDEATGAGWRVRSAQALATAVVVLLAVAAALEIAHVPQDWFLFLLVLVGVWAGYSVLENVAELVFAPQDASRRWLACHDDQARHLYSTARLLALVSAVLVPVLAAFAIFDYAESDVIALPTLAYRAAFLGLLLLLVTGHGGLRALVPEDDTPRNQVLHRAATAAPTVLVVASVAFVVAYGAGYANLSDAVRRAALVAVVVVSAAWAVHRTMLRRLESYVESAAEPAEGVSLGMLVREAKALVIAGEGTLLLVLVGWAIAAAAKVPGRHWEEAHNLLVAPLAEVKGATITALGVLKGAIIVALALLVGRVIREVLQRSARLQSRMDQGVQYALASFSYYGIIALGIVGAAPAIGFDWSVLAVFAGAAGIGIGFGMQDIARNFISGLILLVEQPFKVGEFVEIGGVTGTITDINMRTTTLRTAQNTFVIVPNGAIMSGNIHNWASKDTKVRLDIEVGVAYGTDLRLAREVMLEVARAHPRLLADPEPDVWVVAFGDSAIDLRLMGWLPEPVGVFATQSEIRTEIWDAFVRHGVEIPFPQRDIHIRSDVAGRREGSAERP